MGSLRSVTISWRWQPAYWATVIGLGMTIAGITLPLLAARSSHLTSLVPFQLPYMVSGGLTGLALVGLGAALLNLQVTRHLSARERVQHRQAIQQAHRLLGRVTAVVRSDPSEDSVR